MLAAEKPEQEILIQMEAAKASLASALTAFIEAQLSLEKDGRIELSKDQARAILKILRK